MKTKEQQFVEIALQSKAKFITDLTDVAWLALEKAGLSIKHGEAEWEKLRSAVESIVA